MMSVSKKWYSQNFFLFYEICSNSMYIQIHILYQSGINALSAAI